MLAECLRKNFRNKLYLPKLIGKDQLDDLEPNEAITLKILNEMVEVMENSEVRRFNLKLLHRQPSRKSGMKNEDLTILQKWP